jgi:hypothetical protein
VVSEIFRIQNRRGVITGGGVLVRATLKKTGNQKE